MIKSIEIKGYRILDGFSADLDELTVVIGANATGKSTLMDFLQFISRCVQSPLNDAFKWEMGLDSVLNASQKTDKLGWKLTFRKPTKHPFWGHLALKGEEYYVYEVVIEKDQYQQAVPIYECLRTEKPYGKHTEPLKLLEATRYKSHIFDSSQHMLVPFDEAVGDDSQGLLKGFDEESFAENNLKPPEEVSEQERSLRLAQMTFYNQYPVQSWIRFLLSKYYFYPGFEVGRYSKLRTQPSEIQPHTVLSPKGENLGTVLHEVLTRADYRIVANNLRDFLRSAYPSFDDFFAESTFGTPPKVLVSIREKGMMRKMQLWDLSDGMLRFLCLGTALLNPIPPALIAIDEPEVGLHPRLLPIVADMIKTASEKTQVLVTTHSPDLLNCFDIDNIAVMARDENEITWQRPGDQESLKIMLNNVEGDSLGDLHRSGELEAL
ncbi:MAG TPA: AAA family ATPase [Planctomycetes bacterium]|nr:AAA family ATPase [Planctomycetota bacterium]